jgi:NAD(P)-dependent dehydrogenase (short-subunit alcohol dehydrogenase family)
MAPAGIAILLGAGPTTGAGIARVLARPSQGNMAVALLSRSGDASLADRLSKESDGGVLKAFKTDTSENSLDRAFKEVTQWASSIDMDMKLTLAIWSIKHSHKTTFEEETSQRFGDSLQVYVTGAMVFSQLCVKWFLSQYPNDSAKKSETGEEEMVKRGTLIFTGTLGAMRTNPGYAAYGAGRAGVRMLAQSLAREYSGKGIHVVHAIANGGILDVNTSAPEDEARDKEQKAKVALGERIRAESVGKLYLECSRQSCDLWVHELDMRPAREKF